MKKLLLLLGRAVPTRLGMLAAVMHTLTDNLHVSKVMIGEEVAAAGQGGAHQARDAGCSHTHTLTR